MARTATASRRCERGVFWGRGDGVWGTLEPLTHAIDAQVKRERNASKPPLEEFLSRFLGT